MPAAPSNLAEAVVAYVDDVIFLADRSGRLESLNSGWTRLTGRAPAESIGCALFDFLASDEPENLRARWDSVVSGALESVRAECSIILENLQLRWIELSIRHFPGFEGSFAGIAGTIKDIHDRKVRDATHAEIRHALLNCGPATAFQAVAAAIHGNLGLGCLIWRYHPAEREVHLCASAGVGEIGNAIALRVATEGRPEFCRQPSAAFFPVFAGASIEAVVAVCSALEPLARLSEAAESLAAEITQALQLRDSDQKFQAVFHHSSEAMLLINETGIFDCNQAALNIFACPDRALLIGRHPAQFSPEFQEDGALSSEKSRNLDRKALETGSYRFEWLFADLQGKVFPLEVNLTRVSLGGHFAILALFHNIAVRKAYERNLENAKTEAESANRAKSAFIARVSHQVRTPVNGILHSTRLLLDLDLSAKQRVLLESVADTSRDLLSLLNDTLDLSRMQTGDLGLVSAPLDLRLAFEDVVELLAAKADVKGIDLSLRYSNLLPRRVVGDAGRLRQILVYSIDHAIRRTDTGHVEICVDALSRPDNRIELTINIEDTGNVIPAEQQSTLFDGLADLDNEPDECLDAKALRLAVAGKLLEYIGGTHSLTSEVGHGMRLALKIALDRDPDEWPARRPSPEAVERRILLVLPDNRIRAAIVETLQEWGLCPRVASTTLEALPWLTGAKSWSPDLLLVSSRLAGMAWEEFGQRFCRMPGEVRPVMVLCVYSSETALSSEAIDAGWDFVFPRNIRTCTLLDLLERKPGVAIARNCCPASVYSVRRSVLLVTDDPETLSGTSAITDAHGLTCDYASTLEEALELTKQRTFDIAIIDVAEPLHRLTATVEQIRTGLLNSRIPIVVATTTGVVSENCEALIKPIRPHELESLIRRLISQPSPSLFNRDELLNRCEGDSRMVFHLAQTFRGLLPSLIARLREGAGMQNAAAVLDCARRSQFAARVFAADLLDQACGRLIRVVELRDWAAVPAAASVVKAEADRLAAQLPDQSAVPGEVPA